MRSIEQYIALIRELGPGWLLYRAGYAMRRRFGFLRRATPAVSWSELPAPALSLHSGKIPPMSAEWGEACVAEAEAVLKGKFRLFSHRVVSAGFPPDWHRNQMTDDRGQMTEGGGQMTEGGGQMTEGGGQMTEGGGQMTEDGGQMSDVSRQSSKLHWTELSDSNGGDIKGIWELSRFPWAFALTRAHARTGEEKYADAFWRLFADWFDRNPPNLGHNWMCGQEATFRLMAVTFAAEGLGVPPTQRESLARLVVATGRRIDVNLDYALSQKNNHGVSECVGLITAALLAPAHPESADWLARGLCALEAQLDELVYADGGFSQHSLIYHRVLLHDLCWVHSRFTKAGQAVPPWLDAPGRRATEFLLRLADPTTGRGPLYGPNDGANVLPLADAEFQDLRPVVQLSSALFRGELPFPAGKWDEATAWLAADWERLPRKTGSPGPAAWYAPQAGCWQMTDSDGRIFLRCPTKFRHRPSQADMLHVDVWHGGLPVALDGGSFSYNSRERFTTLGSAALHNTMTVEGIEPIRKFSRFLYLPWPRGAAGGALEDGQSGCRASHNGYEAIGVKWTRSVRKRETSGWLVHDRVSGVEGRALRWHWRLADRPWVVTGDSVAVSDGAGDYRISWRSSIPVKVGLIRVDTASAYGWWSPHYGEVEPATSLLIEAEASGDIELVTEFSPLPG